MDGLDPDRQVAEARSVFEVPAEEVADRAPGEAGGRDAAQARHRRSLATKPAFRELLLDLKRELEQVIDEVSQDELLEAGASEEAKEKARALVTSFERYIEEHKDEIAALQFFYAQPYSKRLSLQGHQGAGQGYQGAAALVDAGEALARLRDAAQGQGAGRVGQAAADGHGLAGALRYTQG